MRNGMRLTGIVAIAALIAIPMGAFAANGEAVYKAKCTTCHAADGSGATPMGKKMGLRDLGSADVQKQTDEQLTEITTNGKGKMPAYSGKLSAEEIKAVVDFMRTLKK